LEICQHFVLSTTPEANNFNALFSADRYPK